MPEQPPLLTIRRDFRRPEAATADAFALAQTAQVADAQGGGGVLDYRIQALAAIPFPSTIAGPALTCDTGPADVLAALATLEVAQPGDVLMIATDGWSGTASIGDQFAVAARNAGIAAIVTDGLVRDVDGLSRAGVPVFATGLTPAAPGVRGPGTVGLPILIGGRAVDAGDLVVCDRNGVVVVQQDEVDVVLAALDQVLQDEREVTAILEAGQVLPDSWRALFASERVLEAD